MSIVRTEEEQKRANEMFDSFRDELLKRELSNTESYDRAILTLSSASLAVSLTAIRFVVPLESSNHIWMIKAGWLLLLFSIIMSLYAYLMSNKAISVQLKNAEDYYTHGVAEAFNRPNKYTEVNGVLNKLTGVMFVLALSSIVIFVTLNINSEESVMTKSKDNSGVVKSVNIRESANVPTMQKVPSGMGIEKNSANIPTMQQAPGTQTTSQSGGSSSGNSGSSGSNEGSGK